MSQGITSYLENLFIISLVGIITESILCASNKNSKSLENALKLVFSLCLTLSVILPGTQILKSESISELLKPDKSYTFDEQELNVISLTKKRLEADITEKIKEKFGIKPDSVSIEFVIEETSEDINVSVESINISLSKKDSDKSYEINKYASGLLGLNYSQDKENKNGT